MTVYERMFQTFCFGEVKYDCKEPLTSVENDVYAMHKAGHSIEKISESRRINVNLVKHHLKYVRLKGWIQ